MRRCCAICWSVKRGRACESSGHMQRTIPACGCTVEITPMGLTIGDIALSSLLLSRFPSRTEGGGSPSVRSFLTRKCFFGFSDPLRTSGRIWSSAADAVYEMTRHWPKIVGAAGRPFFPFLSTRAVWRFATTCYAIGSILLQGYRLEVCNYGSTNHRSHRANAQRKGAAQRVD